MPVNPTIEKTKVHASVDLPIPLHNEVVKIFKWTGRGRLDIIRAGVTKFLDELFIAMDGYFATNSLEKLKKMVENEVGFKFDLRTCRRTFGQMCLDQGVTIESVSVLMGHDSTKAMESYYCRKKEEKALAEVSDVRSPKPTAKTNPTISKDNFLTGYS